jgi:hypothetical protein
MRCLSLMANNVKMRESVSSKQIVELSGACLVILVCVEEGDEDSDVEAIYKRVTSFLNKARPNILPSEISWPVQQVLLLPFAHLSEFASTNASHVSAMLEYLHKVLTPFSSVARVSTDATEALLADLALVDSVLTSRLSLSEQSVTNQFIALLRIFSYESLSTILKEAQRKIRL